MASLAFYLDAISHNKPINYPVMLKKLPKDMQHDHHLIFKTQMLSSKSYQVEVIDKQAFEQLRAQFAVKPQDRIAAALQGDSHQVANATGFMLVFHQKILDGRPDVVVLERDRVNQGFESKDTLLIIENQTNFFAYQQLLPLFSAFYTKPLNLTCCDIVYGAGSQINKALNLSFFEQYHSVVCALDYDLAGLTMYSSLQRSISAQLTFLQPDNYQLWQDKFVKTPDNQQIWQQAIDLAKKLGFSALAETMLSQRAFMEQELFLA